MPVSDLPLWPHQASALQAIKMHIIDGRRRILLTSPTGGGKSRIIYELMEYFLRVPRWKSIIYTNRRMLVEQIVKGLGNAGLSCGVRAAGHHEQPDSPIQVGSIQTEDSRVYKKKGHLKWELFPANVVFIDEAHLQSGKEVGSMMARVKEDHYKAGAIIIEVTATPLDMDGKAEVMVVAGTNSELRECGALVPAMHYGPDEPDLRHIGLTQVTQGDDLSEPQIKKIMGKVEKGEANPKLKKLFGRVMEWFDELNHERRPTILFAPGVAESRWFAEEFCARGIAAAHIDGEDIWTPSTGDVKAKRESRDELLEMSKDGTVKVLCNRFVLREGIDCPWLSHGIFATAFGSLQSYLQSGGRLLRSHPGVERITIQDHGGNWWRHGSLNADRDWPLGITSRLAKGVREDGLREKNLPEPMRCPRCSAILLSLRCVCGFVLDPKAKSRPVVQENGELVLMRGDIFKQRKTEIRDDTEALYARCFYRMKHGNKTFQQAIGLFYQENGYFPPTNLPWMPVNPEDLRRKIADVPLDRIIKPENK